MVRKIGSAIVCALQKDMSSMPPSPLSARMISRIHDICIYSTITKVQYVRGGCLGPLQTSVTVVQYILAYLLPDNILSFVYRLCNTDAHCTVRDRFTLGIRVVRKVCANSQRCARYTRVHQLKRPEPTQCTFIVVDGSIKHSSRHARESETSTRAVVSPSTRTAAKGQTSRTLDARSTTPRRSQDTSKDRVEKDSRP